MQNLGVEKLLENNIMTILQLILIFITSMTRRVVRMSCTKESRRVVKADVRIRVKIISEMQS